MSSSADGDSPPERSYSRAFDNIVQRPNDTVGLLAYALFKQGVREEAAAGRRVDGGSRNPPETAVRVYRDAARRILEEFASNAIAEATPEGSHSSILAAVMSVEAGVKSHIDQKTNWKNAIGMNLIAWVITIAVTALILVLYALPSMQQDMIDAVREIGGSAAPRSQVPVRP